MNLPRVFSHDRLGRSSALLLGRLQTLFGGHLLDFNCGVDVLGAILKRRYLTSRLTLFDVDVFAVGSSRLTPVVNDLDGEVIVVDDIGGAPCKLAATVSSLSPYQGVHTGYQAPERLLQRAAEYLAPGGELRLVANDFLKYPPPVERHLGSRQTLAEGNGFRTYSARRSWFLPGIL